MGRSIVDAPQLISIDSKYVPGVCNIGKDEIRVRRNAGLTSLLTLAVFIFLLRVLDLPSILQYGIFIGIYAVAINYFQVSNQFCVNFGSREIFNFEDRGEKNRIENDLARKLDRQKVIKMNLRAALAGIILTPPLIFILF